MSEYLIQDTTLTSIADEVRRIKSTESALSPADIESQLSEITRYEDRGNVTLNASTTNKSYPAGYYPNAHGATHSTVSRASTTLAAAADTTNAKLTLTAGNNQSTGYVTGSNSTATKTVTLTASGATVTASTNDSTPVTVSKSVATVGRADTTLTAEADTTNKKITFTASNNQGTGYVTGANKTASATATLSISGKTATLSDGTNSVTANVESTSASKSGGTVSWGSGWISSGSETVSRSDLGITDKAAATYNTSTTDQTIAAGNYLTGAQTIKAVTTSGISASNIIKGAVVKVGDANSAGRIANVTGTADYIKTVTSVPTTKDTSIIYNSTDGKYYLWK